MSSPADAVDELHLNGVLRSIDLRTDTIVVDVRSEGCRGLRRFRTDAAADLESSVGGKVSFFIDSSVCRGDTIYRITKITREGRIR